MAIIISDAPDRQRAEAVIRSSLYRDWDWITAPEELSALDANDLAGGEGPDAPTFVALEDEDEGEWLALARLRRLAWDTEVLAMPCARADLWWRPNLDAARATEWLGQLRARSAESGTRLLDLKVDARAVALVPALCRSGYYLVDCLASYALRLPCDISLPTHPVRQAASGDRDALKAIAAEAFSDAALSTNRFVSDANLGSESAASIYSAWVANSLDGAADVVLVTEGQDGISGFITCRRMSGPWGDRLKVIDIPLNAVRRGEQGRGQYTSLVRAAVAWSADQRADWVHVRTQVTAGRVQAAWTRLGARLVQSLYTFHSILETSA
jgi:hypothetical protein